MKLFDFSSGLYTDMYELSMLQSYFLEGKHNQPAAFDYFFRTNPYNGGYVIYAGLNELLEILSDFHFSGEDIDYLHSLNMDDTFLDYLKSFSFKGTIQSVEEGSVVFPYEPVVIATGALAEVQVIETLLLNILNFSSLVATKASRMRLVAGDRALSEFGLRRAQGFGGMQASRAAVIGGFNSTSNVLAAKHYGLVPQGTMAHSFIQSFADELTAFRKYAELNPENCILLVDTYDTLNSGIPNAVKVGKELEQKGYRLSGIRLDSGDLAYLSAAARKILDENNLQYVKIVLSNQIDETVIRSLLEQGAPVDIFGIGTNLVTGHPDSALDGVYKLSMFNNIPRIKISDNVKKMSLPGVKKIIRFTGEDGFYRADAVVLEDEPVPERMFHPFEKEKSMNLSEFKSCEITKVFMERGKIISKGETAEFIREKVIENLSHLPAEHKRFEFPHIYKVGIGEKLMSLRENLRNR
jgi:nicotinate phosphoribosyltransferase